ncbi:unnamed protein product, partial [Phytomonas sp. Hart1]
MLVYEAALYIQHNTHRDGRRAALSTKGAVDLTSHYIELFTHDAPIEGDWGELLATTPSRHAYSPARIRTAIVSAVVFEDDELEDYNPFMPVFPTGIPHKGGFPHLEVVYCFLQRLLQLALLLDSYLHFGSETIQLMKYQSIRPAIGDVSLSMADLAAERTIEGDLEYIFRAQFLLIDIARTLYQEFKITYEHTAAWRAQRKPKPKANFHLCGSSKTPSQECPICAACLPFSELGDYLNTQNEAEFMNALDVLMCDVVPSCSVLMRNRERAELLNRLQPGVLWYPTELLLNTYTCFIL